MTTPKALNTSVTRSCLLLPMMIAGVFLFGAGIATSAPPHPNVLLVVTDDQGYGDLGSHGNEQLDTPRLDALAAESVELTRFYVSPVCSPTRASLLTGRYHLRTGAVSVTRRREAMRTEEVTLAELFGAAGYTTAALGKWHNGSFYPETPRAQGFDDFFGFRFGHINQYFNPPLERNGVVEPQQGYINDLLTDEALRLLTAQKDSDQPFFYYLAYNTPHTPALAPADLLDKYRSRGFSDRDAAIYGMVENLDQNVGRLLDHLDALDLSDDTIVIFMSDNGPNYPRFNSGLKGKKAQFDEGGVRVPCFVRWPDRYPQAAKIDEPLAHIDWLPTLAEWCALPDAETLPIDGRSFVSLFEHSTTTDWPDRLLYFFPFGSLNSFEQNGAVRTRRWTAVKSKNTWSLYDILTDPGQSRDVAAENAWVLDTLRKRYDSLYHEIDPDLRPTPIPLGHPEAPTIELGAHDAELFGDREGIEYNFPAGYANHWITNWNRIDTYPDWTLEVVGNGRYRVTVLYSLPAAAEPVAGQLLVVGGDSLPFRISEPFDQPVFPQPFVAPGEASKYASKPWGEAQLGEINIPSGRQVLRMKMQDLPASGRFEVKSVRLERL